MLIDKQNKHRIATDEETKIINEYYNVILKEYGIKKKQAIRLSRHKKEIDSKFEEHLGFQHYNSNRFNITADLANNAEHLRSVANLTNDCGTKVNSLVCGDLYSMVFKKIISNRENEAKQSEDKKLAQQLFIDEFKPELVDKYIAELLDKFIKEGVGISKDKYTNTRNFNSDDDIVKYRIENLIERFIRTEIEEFEHKRLI